MNYGAFVKLAGEDGARIAEHIRSNVNDVRIHFAEQKIELVVTDYASSGLRRLRRLEEVLTLLLWSGQIKSFMLPVEYVCAIGKEWRTQHAIRGTLGVAFDIIHEWRQRGYTLPIATFKDRNLVHYTELAENIQSDLRFLWRLCFNIVLTTDRPAMVPMNKITYMASVLCEEIMIPRPLLWPTLIDVEESHRDLFAKAWLRYEQMLYA